jgi:hypothetical protein
VPNRQRTGHPRTVMEGDRWGSHGVDGGVFCLFGLFVSEKGGGGMEGDGG